MLRLNADMGQLTATVLIPAVLGVSREKNVEFDTVLIKAASRGSVARPGPDLTYTVIHLRGTAEAVTLPLAQESTPGTVE
jgi:hypothetical protein